MTKTAKILLSSLVSASILGGASAGLIYGVKAKAAKIKPKVVIKDDVVEQNKILDYFKTIKKIEIPATTRLNTWTKILQAIKDAIGSGLTSEQKAYISLDLTRIQETGMVVQGTQRALYLDVKFKSAPKKQIELQVLHWIPDTNRVSLIKTLITGFTNLNTITIPSAQRLSSNDDLIKAIVAVFGLTERLTTSQKNALSIVPTWSTLGAFTKGTSKDVEIKITVGSASDTTTISVTHSRN